MPNIKLRSSDEETIEVDFEVARMSRTIRTMIANMGIDEDEDVEELLLLKVDSVILKKVFEWAARNEKLEFTVTSKSNGPAAPPVGAATSSSVSSSSLSSMTPEEISVQLRSMLSAGKNKNKDQLNKDIFNWIDVNVGQARCKENAFIRVLMDSIADSAIKGSGSSQGNLDKSRFGDRTVVLQKYMSDDLGRQRQALYALQHLMHRLEHPNKLLHYFFEELYNNDIVSDEAFEAWHNCDDPAEQEGKDVAIKSTKKFFTWLRENSDEEDE